MEPDANSKLIDSINKTGFVLENKICNILEKYSWNVISNRYYIDETTNIEREIDIIAYKVKKINNILFYTALIISCKKSLENLWAFLTKSFNEDDPNINLFPIYNKSNNKILNFLFDKHIDVTELFHNNPNKSEYIKKIFHVEKQVFAFQQMNLTNFKCNNDKDIYNSIITSIKALNYERNAILNRKNESVFYNFNLISIFDGEMFDFFFNKDKISINPIDDIKYLNRHILNNSEEFYRVHFINYKSFESILHQYNLFHDWNTNYYSGLIDYYYNKCFFIKGALGLFKDDINKRIHWNMNYEVRHHFSESIDKINISLIMFETESSILKIYIDTYDLSIITFINSNESIINSAKMLLLEYYKYSGIFSFVPDFPF